MWRLAPCGRRRTHTWSWRRDLNPQPPHYKCGALPLSYASTNAITRNKIAGRERPLYEVLAGGVKRQNTTAGQLVNPARRKKSGIPHLVPNVRPGTSGAPEGPARKGYRLVPDPSRGRSDLDGHEIVARDGFDREPRPLWEVLEQAFDPLAGVQVEGAPRLVARLSLPRQEPALCGEAEENT